MDKYLVRKDGNNNVPDAESDEILVDVLCSQEKRRKANPSWMKTFNRWLSTRTNPSGEEEMFCTICNSILKVSAGKADLLKHQSTQKHIKRANSITGGQTKIEKQFEGKTAEMKSVQLLELQLSAFIAEHNLPFSCMDHLTLFLKSCIPDSKVTSNISCSRTKTTCLVKNVLGRTQFEFVSNILRHQKFSLCIDESTDISNKKSLCLVIRATIDCSIKDLFFGLIELDSCDALTIFKQITDYFAKHNISYKQNLIGFAADGASNMTGKNHSVARLFKNEIPNLFVVKCICHSIALCSSYSCLKLPSEVESLLRDVYNYISNSPKRSSQFQKVSSLLDFKPKKMLHPSQTRWLSLEAVVVRVVELYEPLKIYFAFAANIDHIDSAESIKHKLSDINELYLCFLKYILHVVNNVNKIFQSTSSQIQRMYDEMQRLYLKILDNFIKPTYVNMDFNNELSFDNKDLFLPKEEVYLGVFVKQKLSSFKLTSNEKNEFIDNCTAFYVELCKQILKRFDFNDILLKELSCLDPLKIINRKVPTLTGLIQNFSNLFDAKDMQTLDDEFRELRLVNFNDHFASLDNITCEEFWSKVSKITRADKILAFPTLSKFILNLICLPISSANVERIFSRVNLNKTKYRNRLDNITLEGILYAKDYLTLKKCSCYNLKIDQDVMKYMKPSQYYNNN